MCSMVPLHWFGCGVLAVGSVAFYYMPQWFGANALMMIVASIIVGYGGGCWSYAILYAIAFILTLFIRPRQPGFDERGHRIERKPR